MNQELRATLRRIREVADQACDTAHASGVRGAINWGDLCAVRAEAYVEEEGDEGYRVWIEEAAPGEHDLCLHVINALTAAGFPDVEVQTEW